jgi:hypothetical protein
METESPSPYPQVPATCPYPEPTPSSPHDLHPTTSWRSTLILYFHLSLGLPSGPGELHVLLPRELKSALKSTVEFLNTYFELLQFIEIIYITNKCNQ